MSTDISETDMPLARTWDALRSVVDPEVGLDIVTQCTSVPPSQENHSMPASRDIDETMVVNDVLRAYPATVGVFNTFGIDACCGGAVPLAEAAVRDGAELTALLDALRRVIGEDA